jgi:catechol 2,3-dioxygenase-like lactoylglutathione lyase family enzyme
MNSKFNHLTILSEDNFALGRFYEAFFHMRPVSGSGPADDVRIGDGYIGLNIKPRLPGHAAQLDQFGIEVEDIGLVMTRIRDAYPGVEWLEHGTDGATASISTHDPAGNVVLVSQAGRKAGDEIYAGDSGTTVRSVHHFALRVRGAEHVAKFYADIFDFKPMEGPSGSRNFYLSDGRITLVIIPWLISDFEGTGITARGMDHIGFKVESIETLKKNIDEVSERNYRFTPSASIVGRGKEGRVRLEMFRNACPLGCHHMADLDGLLLDVTE